MSIVVYALKCKENGWCYIGCTAGDLKKRMREHKCILNSGEHKCSKLQEDWKVLGPDKFEMVALELLPKEASVVDKRVRELYWMQFYAVKSKLYNQYQVSYQPTDEAIARGQESLKESGHAHLKTPENRARQSEVADRTLRRPDVRAKISKSISEKWKSSDPEDIAWQERVRENLRRGREDK